MLADYEREGEPPIGIDAGFGLLVGWPGHEWGGKPPTEIEVGIGLPVSSLG
jgi:hypothetical protein